MKTFGQVLLVLIAAVAAMFSGAGTSYAGLDNQQSLVDGQGRTLTIQQWDTFLNGAAPLDRNALTREWFNSGRAVYSVTGNGADAFKGVMELGYQVGFPWSMGVGINFGYTTPNVAFDLFPGIATPPLVPGGSISADLGNGPGIQEVATFSKDVAGPSGQIAVSNAHGTVTGAAGGVTLRPYARLISAAGDNVTTFGAPWDLN